MDDLIQVFIKEIKPLFIEYLKTSPIDEKEKLDKIKFFEDRILTLPCERLNSFYQNYQKFKSNPNHPNYNKNMKRLMDQLSFYYNCEDGSDDDSWRQRAKRIKRCQNLQRLPMSQKLINTLIKNENKIRPIQNHEHILLFDMDGKILDEEIGSFDVCGIKYQYIDLPKGTYVEMHNHPLSYNSFSEDDLVFSLNKNIPITRVVTLDGTHEIMFGKDILSDYYEKTKIVSYYHYIINKQREFDMYKFFYEVEEGLNSLGKERNRLKGICKTNNKFAELYKLEEKAGFHDLGRKAYMEA
ncbi:hypothetical protein [Methanocella conradii]|uniref:hypothetical protein n=1 Tax=Methanocella conradii TaxID=1175444 RepID=UPI00157E01C0|nr:hypothetical protein [Methanocella conradii]